MNYGGIDAYPRPPKPWHPWKKKFLWMPKVIDGRVYWLRNVHQRFRSNHWIPGSIEIAFEYQYAVDLFDLMQKDACEKV
jgi:hypothetical protein